MCAVASKVGSKATQRALPLLIPLYVQLDEPFNLETYAVPLREWVAQEQTRNEVRRRFVSTGVMIRRS